MSKLTYNIEGEPKFKVFQNSNYDRIDWGNLAAEIYPSNTVCLGNMGDEEDSELIHFRKDELPSVIALLIMIYTNSYKKEGK